MVIISALSPGAKSTYAVYFQVVLTLHGHSWTVGLQMRMVNVEARPAMAAQLAVIQPMLAVLLTLPASARISGIGNVFLKKVTLLCYLQYHQ